MDVDEQIDRALTGDDRVTVSSDFPARVMLAIASEEAGKARVPVGRSQRVWSLATVAALAFAATVGADVVRMSAGPMPDLALAWCSMVVPVSIAIAYASIGGRAFR